MTKHTWTPEAVHDIVAPWPDLARAEIGWAPESREWVQLDGSPLSADLAAAAHVASGLERLAKNAFAPLIRMVAGEFELKARGVHTGPTLLHAVSAAIMAAGGGK